MVSCLCEIHIWSLRQQLCIPDSTIGYHTYHDKGEEVANAEQHYNEEKQQYMERRDIIWTPKNRRPEKLRDTLKEMEDLLSQYRCIHSRWKNKRFLQLVLGNACIISIVLTTNFCDIEKILIDKSLVGKLSSELACCAVVTDLFVAFSFAEKPRVDYVYFSKRPSSGDLTRKMDRLSNLEPKIIPLDIPGPTGRRLERKLSVSFHQDMLLVWWPLSSDDAWPWSPMRSEKEKANLIVLYVSGPRAEVLSYTKAEYDPVYAAFSCRQSHQLMTLEKSHGAKGDMVVEQCVYDIIKNKIKRSSVTNIPLKSSILCQFRVPTEDKLLLGCADGSLVLYDSIRKVTLITQAKIIPACIAWHPNGSIIFVSSSRGEIQLFDMALSPVLFQLLSEDLNPEKVFNSVPYFRSPPLLTQMLWCSCEGQSLQSLVDSCDTLLLVYDKGPVGVLKLHHGLTSQDHISNLGLIKEYIKHRQLDQAVGLLACMNWDVDGQTSDSCLSLIVNHLLRMPLNATREGQLETTLGLFYAPSHPLAEATVLEFRDSMSKLARRFFHHLLRYARFDKAFLLAVDIGARDLFMDIHYMALDKGETALADVAKQKAEQIDSESLDSFDSYDDGSFDGECIIEDYDHPYDRAQRSMEPDRLHGEHRHGASWAGGRGVHKLTSQSADAKQTKRKGAQRNILQNIGVVDHDLESYDPDLEEQLASELISDYTSALLDDPPWLLDDDEDKDAQASNATPGSVKVINFGMV